jgi:hypothetical protein
MLGRVVLVATDNVSTWRHLSPALAGAGNRVVRVSSSHRAVGLIFSGAVDLVLAEHGCGIDFDALVVAAQGRVPLVALVAGDRRAALLELFCQRGIMNFCTPRPDDSGNGFFDAAELVATCEKILRRQSFGLDKYMAGFGIELSHQVIVHAEERDLSIERLTAVVRALGGGRRLVEAVALVADELITNAVYNAPRAADGTPRYAHISRRDKVALEPTEYVRLDYGSDGRVFGIAVTDSFGGLGQETMRAGMQRCLVADDQIEQKAGGAGLGLYTALGHVNQLVVNVEPGIRTEVIALWDLERRGRGASTAGSLHLFTSDETAARARRRATTGDLVAEAVPQATVTLSESVRRDICSVLVEKPADRVSFSVADRVRPSTAERREHTIVGMPSFDLPPAPQLRDIRPAPQLRDIRPVPQLSASPPPDQWPEATDGVPVPIPLPVRLPIAAAPPAGSSHRPTDISAMRGVQILRRSERPTLEATIQRIRAATHLSDGLETAMSYLLNRWQSSVLLCRVGGSLVPWTGGGDIDSWDAVCETVVPLGLDMLETGSILVASDDEVLSQDSGWLGARAAQPGLSFGPATARADTVAHCLSLLLTGSSGPADGMALSLGAGVDVVLVIFACRPRQASPEDPVDLERLHAELTQLLMRVERVSDAVPMTAMSWAVGG